MSASSIISKVWSFCDILRDDGMGYGDYLEQLTYLLFLKIADEYSNPPPTSVTWAFPSATPGKASDPSVDPN